MVKFEKVSIDTIRKTDTGLDASSPKYRMYAKLTDLDIGEVYRVQFDSHKDAGEGLGWVNSAGKTQSSPVYGKNFSYCRDIEDKSALYIMRVPSYDEVVHALKVIDPDRNGVPIEAVADFYGLDLDFANKIPSHSKFSGAVVRIGKKYCMKNKVLVDLYAYNPDGIIESCYGKTQESIDHRNALDQVMALRPTPKVTLGNPRSAEGCG